MTYRYLSWRHRFAIYAALVLLGTGLAWLDNVDAATFWVHIFPYVVRPIFYTILLVAMRVQTSPDTRYPWWQIWRRYDQLSFALALGFLSVITSDAAIVVKLGAFFGLDPIVWDIARHVSTVAAMIGIPIAADITIAGIVAKRSETHGPESTPT